MSPVQRDIAHLSEIGVTPSAALQFVIDEFETRASKPVTFRLIDEIKSPFRSGIKEYSDRFVIWIDPSTPTLDYALAHEYGHGITMSDPTFIYIDPRRTAPEDTQRRETAQLAASVIEHGAVHALLRKLGFDTAPEALARTTSVLSELTPDLAKTLNRAMNAGDRRARVFALHNADILTTHRGPLTPMFDAKMRTLFQPAFVTIVDASVAVINRQAAGELSFVEGATELLRLVGQPELRTFYVSLEAFRANLQPWVP